jgi:hypothetical protein
MPDKSSRLRQLNTLALTVLVLLGPFTLYYIFYFSNQKSYFTNRDFRLLAVLSKQVELKVDNIGAAYLRAAQAATTAPAPVPVSTACAAAPTGCRVTHQGLDAEWIDEFLRPITEDGTSIKAAGEAEEAGTTNLSKDGDGKSIVSLNVKHEDGASWLYLDYIDRRPIITAPTGTQPKSTALTIHARSSFENLIGAFAKKFVNPKDFDDVIITQENGAVIFQQGPPELNITNLDSLINKDQRQNSSVLNVRLADADYKLFIQPVLLSLPGTTSNADQGVRWFVCGLVRSDHFLSESAAISYTILIVVIFLLLFVALSTPFLKLLFMGARERLRVAEVYFLFFSALMGGALLTVLLLYGISYVDLGAKMDAQLQDLSTQMLTNFNAELRQAYGELQTLNETVLVKKLDELDGPKSAGLEANVQRPGPTDPKQSRLYPLLSKLEIDQKKPDAKSGNKPIVRKNNFGCKPPKLCLGEQDILGSLVGYNDAYPYLNAAVWIDPDGQQRIKWTTKSTLASFFPVKDRAYFKNIVGQQTWECCRSAADKTVHNYYLEPVYSKATGGQQVILSMPIADPDGKRPTWVASLDFRALSLLQTVLPTDLGYGYCVINNEGNVLFHSDESRNLLEDFFAETDNDSYLRSVILARETRALSAQYQGVGHRLFVTPIPDTPWTLVTFQDKNLLRTIGLEVIASSIILFIFYALVLLIFFSFHYLRHSENRAALVWPQRRRAPNYYLSIVFNLLLAVVFGLSIPIFNHWIVLALAFILPALAFSFHFHNLEGGPKLERYREAVRKFVNLHTPLNYGSGYILALVTLFLLTSVLPMLAAFKFSYDREMRLFVGLGQINLARSLEDRSDRVREQYSQAVPSLGSNGVLRDPKMMRDFLEKRLNVDDSKDSKMGPAWDVYSRFFFNTNFQVCDGENKDPVCAERAPESENRFESLLAWILPFNNAISLRIHGLTSSMSGNEQSVWRQQNADSNGIINLSTNEKVDGDDDYEKLHVKSAAPLLGRNQQSLWWIFLFAILGLVPSLLFILIGFIGKRIFLLDTDEPATFYGEQLAAEDVSPKTLVLASSFTRKDQLLVERDFDVIDLRGMKEDQNGFYNDQKPPDQEPRTIALNYFEYNREDPKTNREKVRLLESLLIHNRKVVIVSSVDLTDFCFEETGEGHSNGNGVAVNGSAEKLLSSFFRVYVEDNGDSQSFLQQHRRLELAWAQKPRWERNRLKPVLKVLKSECEPRKHLQEIGEALIAKSELETLTPEEIILHVQEKANAYYHSIWETCSKDEKLTLCNLAKYHLVSSKNPDLPRLMKRGLISKRPQLRIMNESLSRFIMAEGSPEKLMAWQREGGDSSWEMLRVPLFIILISAAAFLFVSQRDLYNSTLAFVSAFAAGMPSLVKLLGLFQSGKVGGVGAQ